MRLDSRSAPETTQTEIETIDGRRLPVKLVVNPRARHVSVRIDPTRREAIATAPSKRHLKHAAQFAAHPHAVKVGFHCPLHRLREFANRDLGQVGLGGNCRSV